LNFNLFSQKFNFIKKNITFPQPKSLMMRNVKNKAKEFCNKSKYRRPPVIKLRSFFPLILAIQIICLFSFSHYRTIVRWNFHLFKFSQRYFRFTRLSVRDRLKFFLFLHAQSSHGFLSEMSKSEAIMLQHKSCVCIIRLRH
jgi:hypothetical protein